MPNPVFKGSITTTGRSEAIRLDKALFKSHPEFRQKAKISAHVIGPGSLLLTLDPDDHVERASESTFERDPIVSAYLSFLERDMSERPDRLQPISLADMERLDALLKNVVVTDKDVIPDDVTL